MIQRMVVVYVVADSRCILARLLTIVEDVAAARDDAPRCPELDGGVVRQPGMVVVSWSDAQSG